MIYLAVGAAVLALLVWAGRMPERVSGPVRIARAVLAALAAAAAVAAVLRGAWPVSLALVTLSIWLGQRAAMRGRSSGPSAGSAMSQHEARAILGVGDSADRAEIEAAYRRLMRRAHPDHGGSSGLAAQLNAARDRLID